MATVQWRASHPFQLLKLDVFNGIKGPKRYKKKFGAQKKKEKWKKENKESLKKNRNMTQKINCHKGLLKNK